MEIETEKMEGKKKKKVQYTNSLTLIFLNKDSYLILQNTIVFYLN